MRNCEFCAEELPDNAMFCGNCGRALPLLGMGLLISNMQPNAGSVPIVQGSPQSSGVPSVTGISGTPMLHKPAQSGFPATFYSSPTIQAPPMQPSSPHYAPQTPPAHPIVPSKPKSPPPQPGGCAPLWLIALFAIIFILSGIITLGLTVLTPSLSMLSGSSTVAIGNSFHLHGSSFIPGSSVTLTLDSTTPLYYTHSERATPFSQTFQRIEPVVGMDLQRFQPLQPTSATNIVSVGLDGSFTVAILIDSSWHIGQHTIRAAEKFTPRSATMTIIVQPAGTTPTPVLTPSATVSPTSTATPSPTASASPTTAELSCVNPSTVSLGPVSEGYTQAVSTSVSLCTHGTGAVNWTATWNTNQDSWLQLDHTSGQIQAPASQKITLSALATNLKAGSYTATITFSNALRSTSETLQVTFSVQTGCIQVNPQRLSFSGIAGMMNPQPQTLAITNCGLAGTWTSTIATSRGVNWLSADPTGNSLNSNASQSVTVTASILKSQLGAGSYSGTITLSIGSNQVSVAVALIVQAAPKLVIVVPNPPSFNAFTQCSYNRSLNGWLCVASISNSSSTMSLNWLASSTGVPNILFKPSSGTLAPNGGTRVIIFVPSNNCQTPTTLVFTGPANTQDIVWTCSSNIIP